MLRLFFFFYCYADNRALLSFPTRRSSDLGPRPTCRSRTFTWGMCCASVRARRCRWTASWRRARARTDRSEEHTSELQSQSNLVCRLLLEKNYILLFYLQV